ncbi:hypothetical protein RRG08_006544 [Elysia crispata]|uniref:Uncharacterized protein n=1 Tax=Elysia crispata TaxID=231223 RepID=A0AAE1AVL1_9GAST|nr:hypothetical protein RRG08_006544 [Elysia crispata]
MGDYRPAKTFRKCRLCADLEALAQHQVLRIEPPEHVYAPGPRSCQLQKIGEGECKHCDDSGDVTRIEVRRRREVMQKPTCIDTYNQKMNWFKRADQKVKYFGMQKRNGEKW